MGLLRQQFRPEFLNRLDEIVFYKPLTRENMDKIVDLLLGHLKKRLADRQLTLVVTPAAKEQIIAGGYDPSYGARPLRRYIDRTVETALARFILQNDPAPGATLTVDAENGAITVR